MGFVRTYYPLLLLAFRPLGGGLRAPSGDSHPCSPPTLNFQSSAYCRASNSAALGGIVGAAKSDCAQAGAGFSQLMPPAPPTYFLYKSSSPRIGTEEPPACLSGSSRAGGISGKPRARFTHSKNACVETGPPGASFYSVKALSRARRVVSDAEADKDQRRVRPKANDGREQSGAVKPFPRERFAVNIPRTLRTLSPS